MTFTEAAVEVLRLVGKPLHYKKITEVAIERNLLSHVGKTPEVTMSSRLATMVKRDRGEVPIIKVKPGVFGLREFNEEQLADLSGDVDELPEAEVTENEHPKPEEATLDTAGAPATTNGEAEAQPQPQVRPTVLLPRKPLPGGDVFPEEEDDDEPILGGDDDEEEEDEVGEGGEAGESAESRSSRRRRKRRRRGAGEEGGEEARPAQEARPQEPRARDQEPRARDERPREDRPREERDARGRRDERNGRREERSGRRDERREGREARDVRDRDRDREGRDRDRDERRNELSLDMSREPADGDLLGKELADAVASVLSQSGPRGLPAIRVADMLVRKGRLAGDAALLVPTVMAAVRADSARRRSEPRPRFRVEGSTLVLTDFLLPHDVVRAEQDVLRAAAQQRERVRRAFLRKVGELPAAGLAELMATWLNAEGVVGLRAVRRPTTGAGELHLAGTLRRGSEEVRIAVIICRDARELGREKVIEARGALHYYGNATSAWLVTLGSVMSGAREEAAAPSSTPIALFDGLGLACAMERVGVGIGVQQVTISSLDFDLLDVLRGSVPRERDAERGREGREGRGEGREGREGRRGERDRDRNGERERPRLVLERPPQSRSGAVEGEEGEESEELDEVAAEGAAPNTEDETSTAVSTEGEAGADNAAAAEAQEGGRRRRRRRRRRGRGAEAEGQAAVNGAEGESAELADNDDEDEPANEGEAAPADEVLRDPHDDADERIGVHDGDNEAEHGHEGDRDEDDERGDFDPARAAHADDDDDDAEYPRRSDDEDGAHDDDEEDAQRQDQDD